MSRGQSHYSVRSHFTVADWPAAQPLLDECVERMRLTSGCIYFGWTRNGNRLFCRQAYINAAGVLAHLASVDALVAELVSGPAAIDSVSVHGPRTGAEEVKAAMASYHGLAPDRTTVQHRDPRRLHQGGVHGRYNLGMLDYNKFD